METLPWFWIWIVLAAALCIGEMLMASFFMLPFAVGAGIAAIANVLGADLLVQWIIFVAVSILALFLLRPLALKVTRNTTEKTGVDRLVGTLGTVVDGNAPAGFARAVVGGEEWNVCVAASAATADAPDPLKPGASVRVLEVDGAHLVVEVAD
jgi:membrane protein implicated in regulation of membrane protease activity